MYLFFDSDYIYIYIYSALVKKLPAVTHVMQSSSKELSVPVSDRAICKLMC